MVDFDMQNKIDEINYLTKINKENIERAIQTGQEIVQIIRETIAIMEV